MAVERLFGTNGIRGIPNDDMSPDFAMSVGKAIGTYVSGEIAFGTDTRLTGDMIKNAVIAGILSTGISVIDLGVLPTPAIQYYSKKHGIYAVVITASHNPPQYNGIKVIDKDGTELERPGEEKIEEIFYSKAFRVVKWENIGRIRQVSDAIDIYINGVISNVDSDNIKSHAFKVLADAGNGAAYYSTPKLLEKLGCSITTLNANPDGRFTARNAEPVPENLVNLISLMKSGRFDLGIAHDGDADRAVFIDEKGNFIDGDRMLALITKYIAKAGM